MIEQTAHIISDWLKLNTQYFINHSINYSKLELELMLTKILKCNRIDLYTKHCNKKLTNIQFRKLNCYVQRRIQGEPIQYILANAPFYGRNFFVDKPHY